MFFYSFLQKSWWLNLDNEVSHKSKFKMSKEEIPFCLMCRVTFQSHEELFHHSCTHIKGIHLLLCLTLWLTMWVTKDEEKLKYQILKLSNVSNKLHITSKWFVSWRLWLNGSDNWYFNVDSTIVTHIVGHNMRDESRLVWPHLWSSALLILQD